VAADVALAIGAVLVVVGLAALAITAPRGLPGASYYEVTAEFRSAANLTPFSEVRMAGKRVGQVTGLSSERGVARVRLQLDPDIQPLPSDTRARIRLKGLLGAKFVDLTPGHDGQPLPDGGTIPLARTSTTVELFDVLDSLDARRRASLGRLVRGLGQGFLGRGEQLNAALGDAPPMFRGLRDLAAGVNAREGAAERFFPSLESAAAAYDPVRNELALGFDPQARSLRPFMDRGPAVQEALEDAPPALDALREGLARNDPLLRETALYASATTRFTRSAPSALRGTAALMRDSGDPLRNSRALLRLTARAVPPTLDFTRTIDPLIEPSIRSMRNSVPGFREVGGRSCDVLDFARNWRSALGFGIPGKGELGNQNFFRVVNSVNPEPTGKFGRNRYPAPCVAGDEVVP
jgi:virulence factor Mce-like protein